MPNANKNDNILKATVRARTEIDLLSEDSIWFKLVYEYF